MLISLVALFAVQTSFSQTFIQRNQSENIIRKVTTPSNTATKVDSITVLDGEAGIFYIRVLGLHTTSVDAVTGTIMYRYSKTGGTLTLTNAVVTDSIRTATNTSGATFGALASNNNIRIIVTGPSSKPIRWAVVTRQWLRRND
jgi:hypothetical protein